MLITMLRQTPASHFAKLVEVLQELGIDKETFLSTPDMNGAETSTTRGHIGLEYYLAAVKRALELSKRDDLGFLVGKHQDTLEQGSLGYALRSSNTLRESLTRYQRYQYLLGSGLTIELVVEGELAKFKVQPLKRRIALSTAQVEYFIQKWLAGWNQWAPLIGKLDGFFEQVTLGFNPGCDLDIYTKHLKCPVTTGRGETTTIFPSVYLDRTLDFSNDAAAASYLTYSEKIRSNLDIGQSISSEIHSHLLSSPGRIPSMKAMAETLAMSARTLRRKLLTENTTYQQLIIDFRVAMARQYLQATTLPANEIATLVGYADTANFYRTFREENGMTPATFRQSIAS
ncbi:MAG: helix-turn-helix domain-containing protein [Halioglobus sp.]